MVMNVGKRKKSKLAAGDIYSGPHYHIVNYAKNKCLNTLRFFIWSLCITVDLHTLLLTFSNLRQTHFDASASEDF